jgi:predicted ArsR family transcriptional regulator
VDTSWDASVQAVAALEEPTRRRLYEYVVSQPEPVGRDDAAAALGIPRTTAAFHLDKLSEEGLLDTCYERRTGRTGPGAGRPAKLYHRSEREIEITLPERQYAVAGHLLAAAIQDAESTGITPREAVNRRAREYGETLGRTARALTKKPAPSPQHDQPHERQATGAHGETLPHSGGTHGEPHAQTGAAHDDSLLQSGGTQSDTPLQPGGTQSDTVLQSGEAQGDTVLQSGGAQGEGVGWAAGDDAGLLRVLAAQGFEPRPEADGIAFANCPFRRLAKEHPQLVCGMNLHLVAGLLSTFDTRLQAELAPRAGRCCVRISGPPALTKPVDDLGSTHS